MKQPIFCEDYERTGDARLRDMVKNTSLSGRGWPEVASPGILYPAGVPLAGQSRAELARRRYGGFNGDGTSDILFQNSDGEIAIWG
jgi:hypothetical protein